MLHPSSLILHPSHVRYQVLAAACTLAVLTYVHRLGFVVGMPEIKRNLGLNDTQAGWLAAAFLVAYGGFQVPGGLLGDRLGGRHLLTLLVLGWSLLSAAVALAVFFPAAWIAFAYLLVIRFVFGAMQAGGFPVLARVLADWMPTHQRGFAQGTVWTFSRLGGALVPFLFLGLFRAFHGWAIPLALMALLGLVWSAAFWPWFRNRPEEMKQVNAAEREWIEADRVKGTGPLKAGVPTPFPGPEPLSAGVPSSFPGTAPSLAPLVWSRFLTSRNVWALCLVYGFVGFSGNFFTNLLPIYLRDHRKLTDEQTAWLSSLPLAFGSVSCLLGGVVSDVIVRRWASRRWGRRLTGGVGVALAGVACLSTIWANEVWLLGLLFSVTFFFNDLNMGPSWAACADVGERHAGTLSGAMNMVGSVFGAAGAAFAGGCFDRGWNTLVFVVFACSYALASLCWLAVDVTKPLVPAER